MSGSPSLPGTRTGLPGHGQFTGRHGLTAAPSPTQHGLTATLHGFTATGQGLTATGQVLTATGQGFTATGQVLTAAPRQTRQGLTAALHRTRHALTAIGHRVTATRPELTAAFRRKRHRLTATGHSYHDSARAYRRSPLEQDGLPAASPHLPRTLPTGPEMGSPPQRWKGDGLTLWQNLQSEKEDINFEASSITLSGHKQD